MSMIQQPLIRKIGAVWGVVGVVGLLGFAVYRLLPLTTQLQYEHLSLVHIIALVAWCAVMAYSEDYKAFGRQFVPRVVARAQHLTRVATWRRIVLAPLFCIGYFGAPRKRVIASFALFSGIVVLIIAVSFVPQPWRGIIDAGVILGLACGISYLLFYSLKAIRSGEFVADPETTN